MSWREQTPSGTNASFVLTDPRLLRMLARRNKSGQDPSAPVVNQETVAPPQASTAPQEPLRPLPALRPDPNQPVTDAGTPYRPADPEPIALPRDFSFSTPRPAFSDTSRQLRQLPIEARQAQVAVRDPNSPEGLRSGIEWELAHPAKAPAHRGFLRKLGDIASEAVISMGQGDPNEPLAARLGRGLGAGIVEGVQPDTIYRQRQQSKIGQSYQRLGALNAIQDEQDKRIAGRASTARTIAETGEANARTDSLRNPRTAPHYETRANGTYVVDSQNPEGRLLRGVPGKPSTARPKTEWIGGVLNAYDENGVPSPVMRDGQPVTSREKTPIQVKMSDGSDVWVTPAEALNADAVRGRTEREEYAQDAAAENENATLQAGQQNEQAQREWQNKQDKWTQTKADIKEYNDLVSEGETARRQALALSALEQNLKEGETLTDAEQTQLREATARQDSILKQLDTRRPLISGDYAQMGTDGRFKLKPEPSRPSPVSRQPVRSKRMPARQSATPGGKKYTEAEVRKRASDAGKNPDDAVKQARAKNLIQ